MKRKNTKRNLSDPIAFTPAVKGVLKRMRTYAERHLHLLTIINAKGTEDLIYPSDSEIDAEFAKRLVPWLIKKIEKNYQ